MADPVQTAKTDAAAVQAKAVGAWQKLFNFVSAHPKTACVIIIAEAVGIVAALIR